jgi:hypothetical protein
MRDSAQGQLKLTDLLHDYWKIFTRESSLFFPHATISLFYLVKRPLQAFFSVVNTVTKEIHGDKYKKCLYLQVTAVIHIPQCTYCTYYIYLQPVTHNDIHYIIQSITDTDTPTKKYLIHT